MCTIGAGPMYKIPNTPLRNHSHAMELAEFNSFVLNFIGFVYIEQICHDSINWNIVDLSGSAFLCGGVLGLCQPVTVSCLHTAQ